MADKSKRSIYTPLKTVFGTDLRTLALFRILLAIYILIDLTMRARDLVSHYTDFGIMPRSLQIEQLYFTSWSLHLANGSAWFQSLLFLFAGVAALGLLLGWRTRLMTGISWVLMLSLQNRNTFILSGEDNLALLLLFWAMFLPIGARYSIDCALSRTNSFSQNSYFSLATVALLLQGMSMYFFSALLKTHPVWYQDGTAVHYALQLDYLVTPFALWFRQFQDLMTGLTYYVYVLELVGPILIFSPIFQKSLRTIFMVAFITMHLAFALFLEIGFFPLISIIMNLTFTPSWMWDKLTSWLPKRTKEPIVIWFDRGCDFCEKICHLLRVFLFLKSVHIRPAQDVSEIEQALLKHDSWVVTCGESQTYRSMALAQLFTASPIFFPFASLLRLPSILRVGDNVYHWIGNKRPVLSRFTGRFLPWKTAPYGYGSLTQSLAGFFLIFITVQNLSTLQISRFEQLPDSFRMVRQALGLYQNWTMFAPYPELTSPWPVIEGRLTDGTVVDVYGGNFGLAKFEKPDVVSQVYENYRWRKFLSNLEDQTYDNTRQILALSYGRFLCRNWTREFPDAPPLATFEIYFQVERSKPPDEEKETQTRRVWSHDCLS